MLTTSIIIKVPFHDVDAMEVAWHGNYAKYFEIARGALLDMIDYNYQKMRESGYAWPVIDMHIKYIRPAVYGQEINVRATLVESENRLKIDYLISDPKSNTKITKGHTIQVAVDMKTNEMQFVSPPALLDRLGKLP